MHLQLSEAIAERLEILERCGSTNTELVERASASPEAWPDFSVLVTGEQTAGRGRLGRTWVAPPGQTIAISVLLRSGVALDADGLGWIPLISGLAMARAVDAAITGHEVGLKWPNDVQIDGLKVAGLLAELVGASEGGGGTAVVMGAGVNLTIGVADLPTATSTSLMLNNPVVAIGELADVVLSGYLRELRALYPLLVERGADAVAAQVAERCTTLGRDVVVHLPDGTEVLGTAIDLDETGRLRVKRGDDGRLLVVAAGDVTHLRYE